MQITHRTRHDLSFATTEDVVRIVMLLVKNARSFRGLFPDHEHEVFLTPNAYLRLCSTIGRADFGTDITLSRSDTYADFVGTLDDFIVMRSPVFLRIDLQDYEGLSDLQMEYRMWVDA